MALNIVYRPLKLLLHTIEIDALFSSPFVVISSTGPKILDFNTYSNIHLNHISSLLFRQGNRTVSIFLTQKFGVGGRKMHFMCYS